MARDEGAGGAGILLAFILGAVSGAAVALLYAPASGSDTREYLGEKAREGRERAAEAAGKGREKKKSKNPSIHRFAPPKRGSEHLDGYPSDGEAARIPTEFIA